VFEPFGVEMTLRLLVDSMLPDIETELQRVVSRLNDPINYPFYEMLTYHMGWSGEGTSSETTGKRIRPLLLLLTCAACGVDWHQALPAAASIELIHNFSLAHDDIQDSSDLRHGRLTVWKKWGMAQAINVGDALFILAHLVLFETTNLYPPEIVFQIGGIIDGACLALSSGQFLDISYETSADLKIEDYWRMVTGKTAALLSACTQVGAILGGAVETVQENYRNFGYYLGLAFQVQDDFLGIWGNSALTGKSTDSDLVAGKKTLPVLYGIKNNGAFARRWGEGPIKSMEAGRLSEQLAGEGAKLHTQQAADQMTDLALQSLRAAGPQGEAGEALFELTNILLNRQT
jgi:geranylgeranyl diphosphate synthase, type I